jgi:hypothetical protein
LQRVPKSGARFDAEISKVFVAICAWGSSHRDAAQWQ